MLSIPMGMGMGMGMDTDPRRGGIQGMGIQWAWGVAWQCSQGQGGCITQVGMEVCPSIRGEVSMDSLGCNREWGHRCRCHCLFRGAHHSWDKAPGPLLTPTTVWAALNFQQIFSRLARIASHPN